MKFEKEKLLVIAPHADDEVLGCCGLINKVKNSGGQVFVQVINLGGYKQISGKNIDSKIWKQEFLNVVKFLDIDGYDIEFLSNKIKQIDTIPQREIIHYLESQSKISLEKIKPTLVAIPTIFSTHQDHVQTYKVAISALRPHSQSYSYLPKVVLSYESPEYYFWSAYSEFGKFSPNFYLQLSKTEIKKKKQSMDFYKSQIKNGERDRDRIQSLAKIRGGEVGVDFAEAFHLHRIFLKF